MGYTTDFIGHIDVTPPLNGAEQDYLAAFSKSRRWRRPGGPYEVPGNPVADHRAGPGDADIDDYNRPPDGQPGLNCDWVPCWDGCCLAFDGYEKFYAAVPWIEYLVGHFLKPDAQAASSGHPAFGCFTFDHRCDGLVVGCRRDNKELFAIRVDDNVVSKEVLRPADPRYRDWPPLPYEEEIDRWRDRARSHQRPQPVGGTVWKRAEPSRL